MRAIGAANCARGWSGLFIVSVGPAVWSFAEIPNEDGTKTYLPIPRDRDQAFGNFDAFLLKIAQTGSPELRKLRAFDADYGSLVWLTHSGRDFDPVLLNRLSREQWQRIAAEQQGALTDEVIDEALALWHPEAYRLDGARLAAVLKARRDKLGEVALEYFDLVNRNAEVVGSGDDDLFELWFEPGGTVRVSVRPRGKAGVEAAAWFDRRYEPGHTAELRLYGREGDDLLEVHGASDEAIVVRFVGGEGDDVVSAARGERDTPLQAQAIVVYDTEHGARIDRSIEVRDERSSLPSLNQYDRTENHAPSTWTFIPGLRAGPDEGVTLGGDAAYVVQGRIELVRTSAGTIGANLSADHGRVFGPSITGNAWHLSLGGSLWWSVMDTMGLSLGYYRGLDGGSCVRLELGPMFSPAAL